MQQTTLTSDLLTQLEKEIQTHWSGWQYVPENKDTISVFDYANNQVQNTTAPQAIKRGEEVRAVIQKRTNDLFGETIAKEVAEQLESNYSISTTQHHTPFSSKETINQTLFSSLAYGNSEKDRKYIIVLACAGIPLANAWNPRGYSFHTLSEKGVTELQLPFFGRTMDPYQVLTANAYTKEAFKQIQKRISHFQSEQLIKKKEVKKLQNILDLVFSEQILKQTRYIDQISIQNYLLWEKLFETIPNSPKLVFLSQEDIASELFQTYHLKEQTSIHNLLFNPTYRELGLTYFNNIACAFSIEQQYGTFLFWGISRNSPQRLKLFPKGENLVSLDGSFSVALTPDAIEDSMKKGDIVPNVLLTFLLLAFYYGFHLGGGLRQPQYLSQIKQGYTKLLKEVGQEEEATFVESIPANDAVWPRAGLVFLKGNNERIPATGLDLLMYKNDQGWEKLKEATKQISYGALFTYLYPELYRDFCKNDDKNPELLAITAEDVAKLKGFDEKIPAWITLEDASQLHTA